jgi:hypothetical protein
VGRAIAIGLNTNVLGAGLPAGTSLAMIEKHYGHLVFSTAQARLARVQLI